MDNLFKKAKEMAQDPAMQERLKNEAQKRFGSGGSKGTDQPERVSGESSDANDQALDTTDETETRH